MSVLGPDSPLFKKEPSRRGQWLVHHPYTLPWLLFVIVPIQEIVHAWGRGWQWFAFALSQVFVLAIFFATWSSLKHMRGFCEFCFHQPAGGPAVAKKHIRQLRIHHLRHGLNRWLYIAIVLALYVPVIFLYHWPYVIYIITFFFLFGYLDKASQVHAWLVPWCPWCKDDGHWNEPSPSPDPSVTKVNG